MRNDSIPPEDAKVQMQKILDDICKGELDQVLPIDGQVPEDHVLRFIHEA